MNMYDSAKSKAGLVEVIYATMDGKIYFLDLETGEKTRDPINIGVPFKGAGSLDRAASPCCTLVPATITAMRGENPAQWL